MSKPESATTKEFRLQYCGPYYGAQALPLKP